MLTEKQVHEIRSHFKILLSKIYFNTCSQGALLDAVESGFDEHLASWHGQDSPLEMWVDRYETARIASARFIQASPDEVVIATSVSPGISGIASALNFLVYNTLQDMNAVADVLKKNMRLWAVAPANVASHD